MPIYQAVRIGEVMPILPVSSLFSDDDLDEHQPGAQCPPDTGGFSMDFPLVKPLKTHGRHGHQTDLFFCERFYFPTSLIKWEAHPLSHS